MTRSSTTTSPTTSVCTLCDDVMVVTFNGLSKAYRACGFRQGWMVITGPKGRAKGYIEGLEMLASMAAVVPTCPCSTPSRPPLGATRASTS